MNEATLDQIIAGIYFPSGYEIRQLAAELKSKRLILDTNSKAKIAIVSSVPSRVQ